jgi:hypothetical protein
MHIFAGWLPRIARFEFKCEAGHAIWEASLQVNAYYLRLREIQSPAFQAPEDAALIQLTDELLHAPDESALLLAHTEIILPDLIAALETHEEATFPNSDQPSVHAIGHALLDLRAQQARCTAILHGMETAEQVSAMARPWANYIATLLVRAGGINGLGTRPTGEPPARPDCHTLFTPPREAERDDRFTNRSGPFAPASGSEAEDHPDHTAIEFERYSTEMLAAETVAVVLHASPHMPWQFQLDSARHLYDEVRHCLMGFEWMRRHGKDPFQSPQYLEVFRWRTQFPPEVQYGMLTMGNEVHAFPYRHRRVEAHRQAQDELSEQFVRYDIADETQHVRFGNRWLPELIKAAGDPRSLEQFTEDILKIWREEYRTGKLPIGVE